MLINDCKRVNELHLLVICYTCPHNEAHCTLSIQKVTFDHFGLKIGVLRRNETIFYCPLGRIPLSFDQCLE